MQRNFGFSLIELLTVIAITGVLAAISYPNYHHYIVRAHRIEKKAALLDLASRMEDYYSKYHTYKTATINTGLASDVLNQQPSASDGYDLKILKATDNNYSLQAINRPSNPDQSCSSMILNSERPNLDESTAYECPPQNNA